MTLRPLCALLCLSFLGSLCCGQPTVSAPNFAVRRFGSDVFLRANVEGAAVDARGDLYFVDAPGTPAVGAVVHRIRRDGTTEPYYAAGFDRPGQLAYNPLDGFVYLVDTSLVLPVLDSRIWRMEEMGPVLVANVPVTAQGFTIDNEGRLILGGSGLQGTGIYEVSGSAAPRFLGPGFGQNRLLQSLVSGDLLIAEGRFVQRLSRSSLTLIPFYEAPRTLGNQIVSVTSLGRRPFNALGAGAIVGVRDFTTLCLCGSGFARDFNLLGGPLIQPARPFADEPFAFPFQGFAMLATGVNQDLYWISVNDDPSGRAAIVHRISTVPAPGSHGSLLVRPTAVPGLSLALFGRPSGGDPFLLGAAPAIGGNPSGPLFVPALGPVALNPLDPSYLVLFDGLGIFGAPSPFAQIGAGGAFQWSVSLPPPGMINAAFFFQALILDDVAAPNGVLTFSNLERVFIP